MEGADGQGAGEGGRAAGVVQCAQRVLPGRSAAQPRVVQGDTALHAHAAARLQGEELHEAGPVCEVFP